MATLDDLSDDVMTHVLSFLQPYELGRFAGTSRRHNALALCDDLWTPLCVSKLGPCASTRAVVPAGSDTSSNSHVLNRQSSRGPDAALPGGPSYRRFRDRAVAFMVANRPPPQRDGWAPGTDHARLRPIARDVAVFVLPSFHVAVCVCLLWWHMLGCARSGTRLKDGAWWTPVIWAGATSTAAFVFFTLYAWLLARGSCARVCGYSNARFPVCLRRAQRWCCLGRRMLTPAAMSVYVEPFSPVPLTMAQTHGTEPCCYVATCAVVLASLAIQTASLIPAVVNGRLQPVAADASAVFNATNTAANTAGAASTHGDMSTSAFDADLPSHVPVRGPIVAWRVVVLCAVASLFVAAHCLPTAWSFVFHARRAPHAPVRQRSPGRVCDHCFVLAVVRFLVIGCLLAFAWSYVPPAPPVATPVPVSQSHPLHGNATHLLAESRVVMPNSTNGGDAYLVLPSGRILQRVKPPAAAKAAATASAPQATEAAAAANATDASVSSSPQPSTPPMLEVDVDADGVVDITVAATAAPEESPLASWAADTVATDGSAPTPPPLPVPTLAPLSLLSWYDRIRALVKPASTPSPQTVPQSAAAGSPSAHALATESPPPLQTVETDDEFGASASSVPSLTSPPPAAELQPAAPPPEFGTMESIVIDATGVIEHGSVLLFNTIVLVIGFALLALCSALLGDGGVTTALEIGGGGGAGGGAGGGTGGQGGGGGGGADRSDCGCLFQFVVAAVRLPCNISWFVLRNSAAWMQWAAGRMWQAVLHPTQHMGTIATVLGVLVVGSFALGPRRFVGIFVAGILFYSGSGLVITACRVVLTGLGISFLAHLPLAAYFVVLAVDSRKMLPPSNPELAFLPAHMRPQRLGIQLAWKAPVMYSVAAGAVFVSSLRYDSPVVAFIQYVLAAWVCTYLLWLVLAAFLSGLAFIHDSVCFWPPEAAQASTVKFQTSLADSVTVWPDDRYRAPSARTPLHAANGATIERVPQFLGAQARPARNHLADFTT